MSYCTFCKDLPADNLHKQYHDFRYGFPINDDDELFGRLIMEINQAGLSWELILKKEQAFRLAFDNFKIDRIASYDQQKIDELLSNAAIIRNKLKINSVIHNANVVQKLQQEYGSFQAWLDYHHPKTKEAWTALFKKTFKFTGGEIVNEFLMSSGYLKGAHTKECPVYQKVLTTEPKWKTDEQL